MQLIQAIKHQGDPFYIQDCARDEVPEFFKSLGFETGAEIGVYKGKFTEKFCQEGFKMFAIDNWLVWKGDPNNHQPQERQDFLYERAKSRLSHYKNCSVIRKNSSDAVKDFKPGSLDFVYIDADHSFRGIADDIHEWFQIIRSGGVISGHDYNYTGSDQRAKESFNTFCQVPQLVDTFTKAFKIKNYYVFGRTKDEPNEQTNDLYLSWLFFKP